MGSPGVAEGPRLCSSREPASPESTEGISQAESSPGSSHVQGPTPTPRGCPSCHITSQGHRAQPQALSRASGGTQPAHPEGIWTLGLTPKQWPQPGSTCPCCTPQCRGLSLLFLPGLRTSVAPGDLPHRLLESKVGLIAKKTTITLNYAPPSSARGEIAAA